MLDPNRNAAGARPEPSGVGGSFAEDITEYENGRQTATDTLNNPSARLNFLCVELQSTDLFRPSLRRREVEGLAGLSCASIYRLMRGGRFPLPVRVSATAVRWKASDITVWIQSRPVATSEHGSTTPAWESPG